MKVVTESSRVASNGAPAASRRVVGGFSLLELMLVLLILGLLAAGAAVAIGPATQRARVKTTQIRMDTIKQALTDYNLNKASFPESLSQLVPEFVDQSTSLTDAWNNTFYYQATPQNEQEPYRLISLGKDGEPGTGDDIDVWTMHLEEDG